MSGREGVRFSKGDRVKLFNMKKTEFEGKLGVISGQWNKKKRRWPVKLDDLKKAVNVEDKNLRGLGSKTSTKKSSRKQSSADRKKSSADRKKSSADKRKRSSADTRKKSSADTSKKNPKQIMDSLSEKRKPKHNKRRPSTQDKKRQNSKSKAKGSGKKKKKVKLKNGMRIKLVNVTKKAYEGKLGTISGPYNKGKDRWPVTLDDLKKTINIKTENLEPLKEKSTKKTPKSSTKSKKAKAKAALKEEEVKPKLRPRDQVDLKSIAEKLPVDRSQEASQARRDMFTGMDKNGSGQLSLAELDLGVLEWLGEECFILKPAIKEAYKAAKGVDSNVAIDDSFVEFREFRILLVGLRRYIELYQAFDAIDDGDDGRINLEEFKKALPILKEWGVEVDVPENAFANMDGNHGGQVLFNEFSVWAISQGLDYDTDLDEGDATASAMKVETVKSAGYPDLTEFSEPAPKKYVPKKQNLAKYAAKLPVGRTKEQAQKRFEMFKAFDVSGSGSLSLAEIDAGMQSFIGDEVFIMKPAIKMAYKVARGVSGSGKKGKKNKADKLHDAFVEYKEFRILMASIRQYIELFAAFDAIDDGDDNRIDFSEFETSLDLLKEWGVEVTDPKAEFEKMDENHGGQVLFEEFCFWALSKGLDYDKDLDAGDTSAQLTSVDIDQGDAEKPKPKKRTGPKQRKMKKKDKKNLGKYAAKLPIDRTQEQTDMRYKIFKEWDVSGSGSLSLAEIDSGISCFLGGEIFIMKPAIKMAYKISRGINAGSKKGSSSFVEYNEFRMLLVNIRQYIEIFAAFDAIDDGDDNRIEYKEFASAIDMIKKWGVTVEDPQEEFAKMDKNGGGQVLFEEFAEWALTMSLDYDKTLGMSADASEAKLTQVDVSDALQESMKAPEVVVYKEKKKYKRIELDDLAAKLPVGRTNEEAVRRKKMFDTMDVSQSGSLSLAEIDLGILEHLGADFHLMKPAIKMAYKTSTDLDPNDGKKDWFVEYKEFRILLVNIRRYIELFAAFDAVDDGDDNRIDVNEFTESVDMLKTWGIEVTDPVVTFNEIDENGGGQLLFNEFAAWALKNGLDYDTDLDEGDATASLMAVDVPDREKTPEPIFTKKKKTYTKVNFAQIASKLPVGRTNDEAVERKKMFEGMDKSCNGNLSLAEIDLGVLEYLGEDFHLMKPAIKMAYKTSKGVDPTDKGEDCHFVDYSEFRILLCNIRRYIELWAAFDAIDDGDDKRITAEEFMESTDMLHEWGIVVDDPYATFDEIDENKGGFVLFHEFAAWALKAGLDYDTTLDEGNVEAVSMKVDVPQTKNDEPDPLLAKPKKKYKKVALAEIAKKLPVGRTNDEAIERKKMFDSMDKSCNGNLSLAEIDLGVLEYLGDSFFLMKPAIKMAYKTSKGVDPTDTGEDCHYVDYTEFRILLCNIRRYIELYAAFDAIDDGDDNRITAEEFMESTDMLAEWGIVIDDPYATFDEIDENGGGKVLFNEFAAWALKKGLDYDKNLDEGDVEAVSMKVDVPQTQKDEPDPLLVKPKKKYKKIDLKEIAQRLPVGRTNDEAVERKKMFDSMDKSCNGNLSLAEIDLGVLEYLGESFHLMKHAIKMAYKTSKGVDPTDTGEDCHYVDYTEFRILLCNIRRYIELYAAFDAIDDGDDNRITAEEFMESTDMLAEWGIVVDDPYATFDAIDTNGGGQVLFNEFAEWALKAGLDYDKSLDEGDINAESMKVDVPKADRGPVEEEVQPKQTEDTTDDIDFAKIANTFPIGESPTDINERGLMFKAFDKSGSGTLSLAEIQTGVLELLGQDIADMSPAIKMAFKISKGSKPGTSTDYVERTEMKSLLLCLRRYLELFAAFAVIDTDNDRRIDSDEFHLGIDVLKKWGVEVQFPQEEFDMMDSNDGAKVLFDEFCEWAIKKNLDVSDDCNDESEYE